MTGFKLLKTGTCLYYHVRRPHSRGYGVHSPFVYRLVRDLLRRGGKASEGGRLAVRLAAWYGCTQRLPLEKLMAENPSGDNPAAEHLARENSATDPTGAPAVCYEGSATALPGLMPHLGRCRGHDVLVLDGIRQDEATYGAWCTLRQMPSVTATIDLWDKGIVFFDRRLRQQRFIVYAPRRIRQ